MNIKNMIRKGYQIVKRNAGKIVAAVVTVATVCVQALAEGTAVDTAAAAAAEQTTAMAAKVVIVAGAGFAIWMVPFAFRKFKAWLSKTT